MLDNEESNSVDLHAKVFYTRDRENRQYVYLGSTNATRNGFERNVEFLMGLRFAPYQCSYTKFRENFINDERDCKFEPMIGLPKESEDKANEIQETLILRRQIASIQEASVLVNENGKYDVTISYCGNGSTDATLYPLMYPEKVTKLAAKVIFTDIELEKLSEFYVIMIGDSRQLIKIKTTGIPDHRDEAICRRIMNKDQFMDCICFLLADSKKTYVAEKLVNENLISGRGTDNASERIKTPALYEELLRTAYERPDIFEDMDTFVSSLPKDIVPDDFRVIYNDIKNALKNYTR